MDDIKILLNETTFTNLCKSGFVLYNHPKYGRFDIPITKIDIKNMAKGEIIKKDLEYNFQIAVSDFGFENIKEIIKRSPLYADLYYEI